MRNKSFERARNVAAGWGVTEEQIDQLLLNDEAVSDVLSIQESLLAIFESDEDRASQWPSRPNAAFGGASAIEMIKDGKIEQVLKHLKYHVYNA